MRDDNDADPAQRLHAVRELLNQGRAEQAQRALDDVLVDASRLREEDVVRSCGLVGRLLALRGDRIRARMMAGLAVELARCSTATTQQAYAYLDQAHTLRALGDRDEALACLRRAHDLAPSAPLPF